ncbi:MAG: tyrosine-protein phosphatase, partial [Firmicutes bacterium]|nr:tyrosine-protein phosphatase [Bacillota bacterium]
MKNVSEKYLEKMHDGIRTFIPRMSVDGAELDGEIQSGLTINLGSCGPSEFTIGNAYIPYITASIAGCSKALQDKEILLEMGLVLADGTVEYKKMGYFTVEKPSTDKFQTSFTAYGRLMSKAGGLFQNTLSYPTTIQSVIDAVSTQTGLTIIVNGLNTTGTIEKPIVGEVNREVLMRIAGLLGGFVTEDGEGRIVISKYALNKAVTVDTDFCYTYPETNDEKYTVTGVSVVVRENGTDEDGNTVEGEIYASEDANVSVSNPYMTESLFKTCEANIVGFSYMPAKVEFLGDISLDPWDSIVLTDIDQQTGVDALGIDIPCMNIVHTWDGGLVTTITAPGSTETETGSSFGGPLSSIVAKTYQKVLAAEKIIVTKLTADEILTDDITAATGNFTKYLTGVKILGDLIEADTLKAKTLILEGEDGIFRRLNITALGEAKVDSDPKYNEQLDGSVLVKESITADKINVNDLFAQNILAKGSITGLKFISKGKDDYNYAAEMVLDSGELHLTAGDGLLSDGTYAYSFHTDVSAHDIELSYDAPDVLNRLWMNGNLIEHIFKDKKSGKEVTVFKSSTGGVEIGGSAKITGDLTVTGSFNGNLLSFAVFSQENPVVAEYLANVVYDPNDYSVSKISNYTSKSTSYRKDQPSGYAVTLKEAGTLGITNGKKSVQKASNVGEVVIYNTTPNEVNYWWNAVDGNAKQCGAIRPAGGIRMIKLGDIRNVRDFGGWACDGGTVKYGMLFRGGTLYDETQGVNVSLTAEEKEMCRSLLGIRHELDLRGGGETIGQVGSALGEDILYTNITIGGITSNYALIADLDGQYTDEIKAILLSIFESAKYNRPTYIHCTFGSDRTGAVAFIVNGLLGVSQSDLDKDYELTSFYNLRTRTASMYTGLVDYFRTFSNGNMRDCIVAWCTLLGISIDDINEFRRNMIDGTPASVSTDINYACSGIRLSE